MFVLSCCIFNGGSSFAPSLKCLQCCYLVQYGWKLQLVWVKSGYSPACPSCPPSPPRPPPCPEIGAAKTNACSWDVNRETGTNMHDWQESKYSQTPNSGTPKIWGQMHKISKHILWWLKNENIALGKRHWHLHAIHFEISSSQDQRHTKMNGITV